MAQDLTFLQSLCISRYANITCDEFGTDTLKTCYNKHHFKSYPHKITYQFNEIGFREKSISEFRGDEILAIGDSGVLGIGLPAHFAWPAVVSNKLNYPVLNFGLAGASNDWMVRKTKDLLQWFKPKAIVVYYTFSHRRERPNHDWSDDQRTECEALYSDEEDYQNWKQAFDYFSSLPVPVVHGFGYNWHPHPVDVSGLGLTVPPPINVIDRARDGFHYGIATSQSVAEKITSLLAAE
jgi:hypothetical protein